MNRSPSDCAVYWLCVFAHLSPVLTLEWRTGEETMLLPVH